MLLLQLQYIWFIIVFSIFGKEPRLGLPSRTKSIEVWDHMVVCKKCPKYKLKTAKSSTHPLRYLLKSQNNMDPGPIYSSLITETFACRPSSISTAEEAETQSTFVDKESQQQMYSELAAVYRYHSQERKESSPAALH